MQLNSPAGDMESLKAAVYNGADAVYVGTRLFSARRLAHNFTMPELKEAIDFAHLHGVKVYLTQNTLVKNSELGMWFQRLAEAYLLGLDAVIIQDIFLAPLIRQYFPDLKVHASTQASFMNWHGINAFPWFDCVVLARELTRDEVADIRRHTKVQLEMFVHGHLCISYSGQCLISSLIGTRSGNRGLCASSCRKPYNNAGYLISSKDLILADHLDKVAEAGIDAIKIEGRMKSPEYVGYTTKIYRKQIDALRTGKTISKEEMDNLRMAFNRDFTSGFFMANRSIVGAELPMNRGIYLGKIKNRQLTLAAPLKVGDGISFWHPDNQGRLEGFELRTLFVHHKEAPEAKTGDTIFIPSRYFIDDAMVFLTSKKETVSIVQRRKNLVFALNVSGEKGAPLRITSGKIVVESSIPLQHADKHALTKEDIVSEFSKSLQQGVQFQFSEIVLTDHLFLPNSMLTKMRKELEEKLAAQAVTARTSHLKPLPVFKEEKLQHGARLLAKVYTLQGVEEANDAGAYAVYYDVFAPDVYQAKKLCTRAKFFLDTPVVLTDRDIVRIQDMVRQLKPYGIAIGNWGLLSLQFSGERHGKYSLNIFNDISVDGILKKGILPTISPELDAHALLQMKNKNFIYYAQGRIPVMHFKGVYRDRALTDEKGYTFPLRIVNGNTEMLYSRPIAVFEGIKTLLDAGVRYFLLDMEKDTTTTIRAYQNIIAGNKQDISMLKKGTTLGTFKKAVA